MPFFMAAHSCSLHTLWFPERHARRTFSKNIFSFSLTSEASELAANWVNASLLFIATRSIEVEKSLMACRDDTFFIIDHTSTSHMLFIGAYHAQNLSLKIYNFFISVNLKTKKNTIRVLC